jgi:uncharacterized protein YbcC (UPF0753/DUF2309 family)
MHQPDPHHTELDLRASAMLAAEVVAPQWPLSSVIAVNPLAGFEDRPYEAAIAEASVLFGSRGHLPLTDLQTAHAHGRVPTPVLRAALERRLGALDDDTAAILLADLAAGPDEPAPERLALTVSEAFDPALRAQLDARHTGWLARWATQPAPADLWTAWRADHLELAVDGPEDAVGALGAALDRLRVPTYARHDYLRRQASALPGWTAHLRWRVNQGARDAIVGHLAALTVAEAHLLRDRAWFTTDGPPLRHRRAPLEERVTAVVDHLRSQPGGLGPDEPTVRRALARLAAADRIAVWIDAYERAVHDPLLASLGTGAAARPERDRPRPASQVVCCIDVRSEGLRRHLEAVGHHETYGYAGFFGLAVRVVPASGRGATDQCPVLLQPEVEVQEVGGPDRAEHDRRSAGLDAAWDATEHDAIAPLALAEGAGWLAGPLAALRTAAPGWTGRLADRLPQGKPRPSTGFDRSSVPLGRQADVVGAILRLGLGTPAPLVVLCGHDARSDNNPMASGLACGACGGHGGGPNARIVAAMANDPEVRAELAQRGTPIPDDTWFLAAVHETTTDQVSLLDTDQVPPSHRDRVTALLADLDQAGAASARERAATLPGRPRSLGAVRRRGRDWAEPTAELGLAGNAAFIVGPRSLTAGLDLGRRTFLHSYEAAGDPDGAVLTGILTAPLVVAQWINAQYGLSTTDPEVFGSGTKAVHNVLGDVGVLSGGGGDLRRGLAWQSVRAGDRLLHEPVRLLAVVEGRRDHVDAAIAGSEVLQRLVEHGWIHLVARDRPGDPWQQRTSLGWIDRPLDEAERSQPERQVA